MKTLSVAEAAYLAGIIDGEGTITVSRKKDHNGMRGGYAYRPYVAVANTNILVLEWCRRVTGIGRVGVSGSRHGPRQKQGYRWQLWSQKAGQLLRAIRPYLVIKIKQADILILMIESARDGVGRDGLTTTERQFQIETYETLKLLNKRGR